MPWAVFYNNLWMMSWCNFVNDRIACTQSISHLLLLIRLINIRVWIISYLNKLPIVCWAGVINCLAVGLEEVQEVGLALCHNPLIRKISFTGSTNVGKWLMREGSSTVKRVRNILFGAILLLPLTYYDYFINFWRTYLTLIFLPLDIIRVRW